MKLDIDLTRTTVLLSIEDGRLTVETADEVRPKARKARTAEEAAGPEFGKTVSLTTASRILGYSNSGAIASRVKTLFPSAQYSRLTDSNYGHWVIPTDEVLAVKKQRETSTSALQLSQELGIPHKTVLHHLHNLGWKRGDLLTKDLADRIRDTQPGRVPAKRSLHRLPHRPLTPEALPEALSLGQAANLFGYAAASSFIVSLKKPIREAFPSATLDRSQGTYGVWRIPKAEVLALLEQRQRK